MRLARRERRQGPNGYVRLAARNVAQNKLLIESDGPKKWKYLWLEGRLRGLVFFPNQWSPHLKVMLHPLQMLKLYPVLEALLQD
jgi:hypothetical protein